jgi:probable HAF family extracellular repeat protein
MFDLGVPASKPISYGNAVNNSGQVAGNVESVLNFGRRAFLSGPNGAPLTDSNILGTLAGDETSAMGVNDIGQVTGYSLVNGMAHAFLTGPGGANMFDLGTLGGQESYGVAVNNQGQVAGYSNTANGSVIAFISGRNGTPLYPLGTLSGSSGSKAQALNDRGVVVGIAYFPDWPFTHAFVYTSGSGMADLNKILPVGDADFTTLVEATGIDEDISICGNGETKAGYHAFYYG